METNKATKIIDQALNSLTQSIENGHSDTLTAYLKAMSHFRRYSLHNILLITVQRPEATRVAGFHAWRQLGRHVIKGQKGIAIVAPMISKKDTLPESGESEFDLRGFRIVHVFDVTQTDGQELPEMSKVKGDPQHLSGRLNDLIQQFGIHLEYSDEIACDGLSSGAKITIRTGLTPAEDFSVRVHELAHELLHKRPSDRSSKKQIETEAEAVAYVVCQSVGLDTNSSSQDYIHLYHGDKEALMNSFQKIKDTSSRILEGLSQTDDEK